MERSLELATGAVAEDLYQNAVLQPLRQLRPVKVGAKHSRSGSSKIEVFDYSNPGRITLSARRDRVLFLCNGDETARLTTPRGGFTASPHSWTYLGAGPIELSSSGGIHAVVAIQKAPLQAFATAKTGAARKVADGMLALLSASAGILSLAGGRPLPAGLVWMPEDRHAELIRVLASAMLETTDVDHIFPIARGTNVAMSYIGAHLSEPCTPERLARVVGVTPRTVREGFHNFIGISVSHYVRQARLLWVRARLEGGCENRSVRDLAAFLRFQDSSAFSRAYQCAFGETPTETRARAAQSIC